MELLLTKPVVVSLAIIGAVLSTFASVFQRKGMFTERNAKLMNYAGYGAMGASMLLFALAGLWS